MIDRMAGKIAQWNKGILKLSEEESKVVEYGISVFLDSVFKFLVLLFISILIGKEIEFGLCLFSFCGLRYWAGGIHCAASEPIYLNRQFVGSRQGGWQFEHREGDKHQRRRHQSACNGA